MKFADHPQLPLDDEASEAPGRLGELLGILRRHGGWLTSRDLAARGFEERELRELSELDQDGTVFSHPGSPGYKHFDHVTDKEFDKAVALKNQGEKMLARWVRYQGRWHRRFKLRGSADEGES
jgi:hypothetical protein